MITLSVEPVYLPHKGGSASSVGSPLPRPPVCEKKRRRDELMALAEERADWVVGFEDECWWSRVAQPTLHSFSQEGEPLRLVEQSVAKDDPDPKAICCCYGGCIYPNSNRELA